jgi:hypothetical protein
MYQLLERAALAQEDRHVTLFITYVLRMSVTHGSLKAVRSGLYIPRIHHFHPGDYVFILPQGQKPGGTLGIPARNRVM